MDQRPSHRTRGGEEREVHAGGSGDDCATCDAGNALSACELGSHQTRITPIGMCDSSPAAAGVFLCTFWSTVTRNQNRCYGF